MKRSSVWHSTKSASNLPAERISNSTEAALEAGSSAPEFLAIENFSIAPLNNWHSHLYGDVFEAIATMAELPEPDTFHLEREVADRALTIVAFLKENLRVAPPKIVNQDGEALSLTWSEGVVKKYLTVGHDEVDLMLFSRHNYLKCEETLSDDKEISFSKIAERLSTLPKSSSVES